jgi:hypothetical protein
LNQIVFEENKKVEQTGVFGKFGVLVLADPVNKIYYEYLVA